MEYNKKKNKINELLMLNKRFCYLNMAYSIWNSYSPIPKKTSQFPPSVRVYKINLYSSCTFRSKSKKQNKLTHAHTQTYIHTWTDYEIPSEIPNMLMETETKIHKKKSKNWKINTKKKYIWKKRWKSFNREWVFKLT